jgi:hypothetical protein
VKSIGQKYRSNGALGNFDGSPNSRTHSAVYLSYRSIIPQRRNWPIYISLMQKLSISRLGRYL